MIRPYYSKKLKTMTYNVDNEWRIPDRTLSWPVKIHAVVIGHKALDVARMVVLTERRKGAGNVQ